MRFRTLFLSSLLVPVSAICVAFVFGRRAREREAVRHEILLRLARLESDIESSARTLAESGRRHEALQVELARAADRPASKPAESAPANQVQPNFLKEVLAKDPRLQAMALENERLWAQRRFGRFFQTLGLNDGEIGRLTDAILAHRAQRSDIDAVARTQRLGDSDPAIATLRKETDAVLEATQREILGDDRYRKLQEHERLDGVRGVVNELVGRLAVDGLPLTEAQANQLVQSLADSNTSYRAGKAVDSPWAAIQATGDPLWRGPLPDTFDWNLARQRARAILSDAQFSYFEQKIAGYEEMQLINMVVKAKAAQPGRG